MIKENERIWLICTRISISELTNTVTYIKTSAIESIFVKNVKSLMLSSDESKIWLDLLLLWNEFKVYNSLKIQQ